MSVETNEPFLRSLAALGGGKFAPKSGEIFARPTQPTMQRRELTDDFLIASLLLLPLDIWLRRRTWRR